ncbi:hypothetical protein TNCV_4567991 [Trichonephila clavipes]|nr:hypothetical protein TNCV_4567991 [Trichonephila clavipes]
MNSDSSSLQAPEGWQTHVEDLTKVIFMRGHQPFTSRANAGRGINVPFTDESRFHLESDNRRLFIWRSAGTSMTHP